MCDINMTTFDKGGVNTSWLGGVEFFRVDYFPLVAWLDKPPVWICLSWHIIVKFPTDIVTAVYQFQCIRSVYNILTLQNIPTFIASLVFFHCHRALYYECWHLM